ncbi:MAG: potassium transporter TrkH [Myxococcales bacterium]|nr:potassium transporter TrkH [Myxococcales bacterium]
MAPFSWTILVAWLSSSSLIIGVVALGQRYVIGARWFFTIGVIALPLLAAQALMASPLLSLFVLICVSSLVAFLWGSHEREIDQDDTSVPAVTSRLRGAAIAASGLWAFSAVAVTEHRSWELLAIAASFATVVGLALVWVATAARSYPRRAVGILGGAAVAIAVAVWVWGDWWPCLSSGMIFTGALGLWLPRASTRELESKMWDPLLSHPARLLVGTFLLLCVAGTFLLALPQSASNGRSIGLLDAVFTAVSAVCVTGLIVLDTPVDFSALGQVIILLLIQMGGLGIMTFSTAAVRVLGGRMNLRHESAVSRLLSSQDRGRIYDATTRIVTFALLTELVGASLLTGAFRLHGDEWGMAMWRGVFTSVSAFCNAGFAIQSSNLLPYQHDPLVLHVVGILIVTGGLSPATALALPSLLSRRRSTVSVQSKLALLTTAVLIVVGFMMILAFEWDNALGGLSLPDRLHNAWFQSITLRTAGFNSVDLAVIKPVTLMIMMVWMFIGGSPGGTAGGIRTTTAAVLFVTLVHAVKGQLRINVFGRTLGPPTVYRAAVIAFLASMGVLVASVGILLTQSMPARAAVFEVVSALGTVGLSIGATSQLDAVGKVMISICMFVGRVGMLSLLMFAGHRRPPVVLQRPEVEIDVG